MKRFILSSTIIVAAAVLGLYILKHTKYVYTYVMVKQTAVEFIKEAEKAVDAGFGLKLFGKRIMDPLSEVTGK